ncbi:methyl-accepting chemotaxis protein [Iningainema tapete]|uniref:GAF domain-containing protein n=1 Tax=Iningainema tapete BLCC-T55 TaxID=2748662 RepID=A0A8J6XIX3_9CYAN|nr:GAF domain-containing protein [Iningainema tapete]MBD2771576.1 GAF domain-containing protein [Iningainema tapete BLCC-T55]
MSKVRAAALAFCMLPILAVGTFTYLSGQLIGKQITQAKNSGVKGLEQIEAAQRQQLPLLLIGTGVTAVVSGALAAIFTNRTLRPVLNAAATSTTVVNRLRLDQVSTGGSISNKDELVTLEANIKLIEKQLPEVLSKQEAEAEPFQVFTNIVNRLRESLSSEEVFKTTVEEIRTAFRTDRVVIFRFDSNSDGTVVEESVAPGLPKMLWATIEDPCFSSYVEQYRNGHVQAIDNIYQAGLSDCYIGLLQRFAVKANLVAPIVTDNQLFGLLIAHQCSEPRFWEQVEIDLFAQLAAQVGFSLDYARLLETVGAKADQAQVFIDITRRIRKSLNEEDVLNTTVEEMRKAIRTDRVLVYGFDKDWYGTVIAESVVPGFPKALRAQIKDPCFAEGYVSKYQAGRVVAIDNIYEAGLSDCYLGQLEPFAVKANLVAPILKDGHLFGLLIGHHCSAPRHWQQFEIDLITQIAMQVGYALDHARLLKQVDQAFHAVEVVEGKLSQQIKDSQTSVEALSNGLFNQMESVTATYNQILSVADLAQSMQAIAQQVELYQQHVSQTVRAGHQDMNRIVEGICAFQETVVEVGVKVKRLEQPCQKLSTMVYLISNVAAQMKLQTMNAFEAENILSSARKLEADIGEIKTLVASIVSETREMAAAIESGKEHAIVVCQLAQEQEQKLHQIAASDPQITSLLEEIASVASQEAQLSTNASQSIILFANISHQTSEQSQAVADSLANLAALTEELSVATS